ncbi:uncharacterized protein (DUF1330 family) [Stella humosa]|uniref:Uncharacterized protein (DUF1330 family) n=1 Tax=Stella humosa TaxID=94 RepID=A0A3N1KSJ6_9PROT|nr:DUF1330 domain-containing protein [Stella humosa]ROP81086.1 uncharacterized protein (DUF1330 family) [Stella humosa]BBK29776.1 hypothetical protein STHU_04100 [Stella humosa]
MKGYVIASVEVQDPALYETYRAQVLATIEKHGGRFLVRGGQTEQKEGAWTPGRIVVLEFPSLAAARTWYDSPDYQPLAALRGRASRTDILLLAEGAP